MEYANIFISFIGEQIKEKENDSDIAFFPISNQISKSVESIFKHIHFLNEFNERRLVPENH